MAMPMMLKVRWASATVTAAALPVPRDARIAVMVVPIFAPSVYG